MTMCNHYVMRKVMQSHQRDGKLGKNPGTICCMIKERNDTLYFYRQAYYFFILHVFNL
jgi:hypothetical protein